MHTYFYLLSLLKTIASEGQKQKDVVFGIKDQFVIKKHQMLVMFQWRKCVHDDKNIASNDDKKTEAGYKNANRNLLFA